VRRRRVDDGSDGGRSDEASVAESMKPNSSSARESLKIGCVITDDDDDDDDDDVVPSLSVIMASVDSLGLVSVSVFEVVGRA